MTISWLQAIILGIFACLSSMPGMGGTTIGNYTLGRPLVAGLVCGIVLGDIQAGVLVGAAMQVVYIALVTPGGTVSADVRAVSYIGIPLAMLALNSYGLDPASAKGISMATSFGAMVGTIGTVLFYGTATINLVWQHIGWQAVEKGEFKRLYVVDMVLPWISHIICSFLPAVVMCKLGVPVVEAIKTTLPMDGIAMKTLFTVGSLLPCVGIAILLKQVVTKAVDFIPFFFGFTLAASMGLNLVSVTVVAAMFAIMQTFGYLCAMLPLVEELYDTKEEQKEAMNTYTAFFNTEPQVGSIIVGITAGLEEAKANGNEDIDAEAINGIRAGLMGPLAGIGDSLVVGTLIPILLGIALGLSTGGSVVGPIFYIVAWNLIMAFGMKFLYFKGYELGGKAVDILVGEQATAIREAIVMLGTMVVGSVAATWVSVKTSFHLVNSAGKEFLNLQNQLDGVYPGFLTAAFVIFCWWLMSKKKVSPVVTMLILVVVAFIGVMIGFFNPGLKY